MNSPISIVPRKVLQKIKLFFDETDIRVLVFTPPTLGFGIYLAVFLIMETLLENGTPESYIYIGLGITSMIACIGGIAEIYKKEAPGSLGKIIKGKMAIISGVFIVLLFGSGGLYVLIYGMSLLFSK